MRFPFVEDVFCMYVKEQKKLLCPRLAATTKKLRQPEYLLTPNPRAQEF